jgi:hypothetical protein
MHVQLDFYSPFESAELTHNLTWGVRYPSQPYAPLTRCYAPLTNPIKTEVTAELNVHVLFMRLQHWLTS